MPIKPHPSVPLLHGFWSPPDGDCTISLDSCSNESPLFLRIHFSWYPDWLALMQDRKKKLILNICLLLLLNFQLENFWITLWRHLLFFHFFIFPGSYIQYTKSSFSGNILCFHALQPLVWMLSHVFNHFVDLISKNTVFLDLNSSMHSKI